VYVALVAAFITLAYIAGPEPHPQLGALFIITFFLLRAVVKMISRRQAHRPS
jgi:hypothetical protein